MTESASPADDNATQPQATPEAPPAKSSTALAIRIVLLAVLGLLVVGLIYDYRVARPAHEEAWAEIQKMLNSKNTDAGVVKITNKDVQEKFGRTPSSTYKEGRYTVEVFSWRTGLLVTSYPIYVYYEGEDPLRLALANPSEPIENLEAYENVTLPATTEDADSSPNPPEDSGEPTPEDGAAPTPQPADAAEPTPADAAETPAAETPAEEADAEEADADAKPEG